MSKIAIIDMGTNTFHLLVADQVPSHGHRILYRSHEVVKLGKGGINNDIITEDAWTRAVNAMKKFRSIIDQYAIDNIHAFGTSAIRNAKNGPALTKEIEWQTGIPVRVISGDEEAALIFAGIRAAIDIGNNPVLIMDIGAGSVEFIIGNGSSISWKRSFEIGGQRLLERFMKHDPIDEQELRDLDSFFSETLQPLLIKLRDFEPGVLVGSSGTFDTVSEIYCKRNGIAYRHDAPETPLTIEAFFDIYQELVTKNREQRLSIDGMMEMRVDMIVVACCLLRFIIDSHNFSAIRVSTYSLKEGALSLLTKDQQAP